MSNLTAPTPGCQLEAGTSRFPPSWRLIFTENLARRKRGDAVVKGDEEEEEKGRKETRDERRRKDQINASEPGEADCQLVGLTVKV